MGKESNKYEKQTLVPFSLSDIYNFITIFAIMSEKTYEENTANYRLFESE